jgi:ketose-bisphosphate aldolase
MIGALSEVLGEPGCGRAVGAFTAYDLETACAVLAAAERTERAVILLLSRAAFDSPRGAQLAEALTGAARTAEVEVCLQLDHVADMAVIERAGRQGFGAVMADGSKLDFERNIELVAEARRVLDGDGVELEGELGHLSGGEDVARAVTAGGLTDPAQVSDFVARTGVNCLAVSIGNVHGTYAEPPRLDWDRLAEIRRSTDVHLSLHGASGLSDADLSRAVELGITKVNVNLELRQAYIQATADALDSATEGYDMLELHDRQVAAVEAVAAGKLAILGGAR